MRLEYPSQSLSHGLTFGRGKQYTRGLSQQRQVSDAQMVPKGSNGSDHNL